MKRIKYYPNKLESVMLTVTSLFLLALILYNSLQEYPNLSPKEYIITIAGLSLFGTGVFIGIRNILSKEQKIMTLAKNKVYKFFLNSSTVKFIIVQGVKNSTSYFLLIVFYVLIDNESNLLVNYWQLFIAMFLILIPVLGIIDYYKYKMIHKKDSKKDMINIKIE